MSANPEIFFHIGLGKTGTTFLQYRAFPFFSGLEYIQRTRFRKAKEIIRTSSSSRFFISFECDQQLEDVAKDWAMTFPDTRPIIVFRRHDSWIASQYRRFVKNCHVKEFKELYHLDGSSGLFKEKDLLFYPMVEMLELTFNKRAIVLLYDDMRADPKGFITNMAAMMGSDIDLSKVNFSNKHSSYSEKQLKGLRASQKYINLKKKVIFKNRTMEFFRKTAVNGTRYLILAVSRFVPDSKFSEKPLVTEGELSALREVFASDWDKIVERAKRNIE